MCHSKVVTENYVMEYGILLRTYLLLNSSVWFSSCWPTNMIMNNTKINSWFRVRYTHAIYAMNYETMHA